MKSNRSILYKQKKVILTIVDGVLHLVCAVYLRYTSLKFYFTFKSFTWVQYLFSSNIHKNQKCSFWCNDNNCSYVGKICTFFLWEGQGHFWIRIWFHLGRAKGRGKRGYGGEAPNEGYFCKIPIIQQDINFISQTFGQTNFLWPPLQLACPKTYMQGLPSDLKQFFLVKNNLLTSVQNDTDDYNRAIGIALLKPFSCANNNRVQIPNFSLYYNNRENTTGGGLQCVLMINYITKRNQILMYLERDSLNLSSV